MPARPPSARAAGPARLALRLAVAALCAAPLACEKKTDPQPQPEPTQQLAPAETPERFVGLLRAFRVDGATPLRDLALAADGEKALVAGWNASRLRLWELRSGQVVQTFTVPDAAVSRVALSADGLVAAAGASTGPVRLFDARTGALLRSLEVHTAEIGVLAFSPDSRSILSAGKDRLVQAWDVTGGQHLWHALLETNLACAAYSPDGQRIAACMPGLILVWEAHSGRELARIRESTGALLVDVAFAADGRTLVTAGYDGVLRVWDWVDGHEGRRITVSQQGIETVALSADGRLAVTGGMDKLVRVWRLDSGREVIRFEGHELWLRRVGFADADRVVVSAARDNTVRVWGLPPQ